jgi:p-aminobenzoyl-glutamate transporter AbgT
MNLEHDLERVLRRERPPAGFASRVMQRIEADQPRVSRSRWLRATAASVTLVAVLGGYATHKVVEHRRGEHAKEQVLEAMRIASEKMHYAQQEVREIGSPD